MSKEALADAVASIDLAAVVAGLLRSKREVIRLQALNFLYDRMLGKPKQDVTIAGGIAHHVQVSIFDSRTTLKVFSINNLLEGAHVFIIG